MVFLDFVVVGLPLGLLLGGSLSALAGKDVRSLRLAYGAVLLQVAAFPSGVLPWSTPDLLARGLWLLSYALLIGFVCRNLHFRGIAVVGFGLLCNLVAIVANGGHMPAKASALEAAGLSYHLRNNSVSAAHPQLSWLVDRWAAPHWLPFANVFSVGDVLIGAGTLVAVVLATGPRPFARAANLARLARPRQSSA